MRARPVVTLLAALAAAAPGGSARAQIRASERATLTQTISGTVITIDYARPSLRGRDSIFGTQVRWGEVWTPGANKATTLRVSKPVRLDGKPVPAGAYSVWIAVRPDSDWIFYLHPDTTLFHMPHPAVASMVFALPVTPHHTADARETLSLDFEKLRASGAVLELRWDHTLVAIDVGVDVPPVVTTVDSATGRRYAGTWTVTDTPETTDSATPTPPYTILTRYDEATRQIVGFWGYDGKSDPRTRKPDFVFVPKAEGIFLLGILTNGELTEVDPTYLFEFALDGGRATSFQSRTTEDDKVWSRGVRQNGATQDPR
jgi:hypothetical protein